VSQGEDKNTTKRICNLLPYTETSGGIFWKQWTETGMNFFIFDSTDGCWLN
jgi:hypothetical protein